MVAASTYAASQVRRRNPVVTDPEIALCFGVLAGVGWGYFVPSVTGP